MYVKDVKEMLDEDDTSSGDEEGGASEGDHSLFNLIRNESEKKKKKRRVNFIVTLAGGGVDYVPSRGLSFMIRDTSGGSGYVPKRARSEEVGQPGTGEKGNEADENIGGEVVREVLSPVGEASGVKTSGSGRKSRRKNKRAKCAS